MVTMGAMSTAAWADITFGVNLSLTGGGAALGLPMQSMIKTFPSSIAGEKVNVIVLDDASDPGKAAQNARRFVNQDKVDVIFGGNLTPTTMAIGPIATEAKTVQISGAPGKDGEFVFILPQGFSVMAHAMMQHIKAKGVKTLEAKRQRYCKGGLWSCLTGYISSQKHRGLAVSKPLGCEVDRSRRVSC